MKFVALVVTRAARTIAALALASLSVACAREPSPAQQVRAVLAAAERGAESRDLPAVMALVAMDYADQNGFDRARLRDFLRGYFLLHPRLALLTRIESLEFPADDLARLRVTVGVLGTRAERDGEDWSLAAQVRSFDLELVRADGDWRLLRAERADGGSP